MKRHVCHCNCLFSLSENERTQMEGQLDKSQVAMSLTPRLLCIFPPGSVPQYGIGHVPKD